MSIAGVHGVSLGVFGSVGRYTKIGSCRERFWVQDEQTDLYWVLWSIMSMNILLTSFRGPWRTLEAIPHLALAIL